MNENDEFITPKEIAANLRISLSSAYTLVQTCIRHNRLKQPNKKKPTYRVPLEAYREYLASTECQPEAPAKMKPPTSMTLPPGVKRYV